jgi:multiple sugar transport system substrate-binding protein
MSLINSFAHTRHPVLRPALVVLLALVALVGCTRATPTPEPVTLIFPHLREDGDYYEPLVQQFQERYPYVTVELRALDWRSLNDLDGSEGDVFWVTQYSMMRMQQQGLLLDVDSLIEQAPADAAIDADDFYPGLLDALVYEGKTWAIPTGADVMIMYYNRDLFDLYNVPYPQVGWTWDDFLAAAMALRDPGAGIFGYAGREDQSDSVFFIYQHGGKLFDDLRNPTRTTFDDPLTVDALEWYAKLFLQHNVAPTPEQAREWGARQGVYRGIYNGKVGMWMGGLSERGGLAWQVEWMMNWGAVPLPADVQSATQAQVEGYAISSHTEHREACWRWIAFLTEQVPYRLMPARRSLAESELYEEQVGAEVAAAARASIENAMTVGTETSARLEAPMEVYMRAVGQIVSGEVLPEEAMHAAQQEAALMLQ